MEVILIIVVFIYLVITIENQKIDIENKEKKFDELNARFNRFKLEKYKLETELEDEKTDSKMLLNYYNALKNEDIKKDFQSYLLVYRNLSFDSNHKLINIEKIEIR